MSELREDPLSGRLVLVAPGRAARPHTVAPATTSAAPLDCPFCPGAENQTPPELHRTGDGEPGGPGWRVRVFPNLFPIIAPDAAPGATGAHEVIVLSPSHERDFAALTDAEAIEVMRVLRDRARHHADAGRAHVQVLVNHGRAAGASIAHPHGQLMALDLVPPAVVDAQARFARSDVVTEDLADAAARDLVVIAGSDDGDGVAAAWCPWGSSSPAMVRVAVRDAGPNFERATDEQVDQTTRTVRRVLAGLAVDLGEPPYNVVVHSAPTAGGAQWARWYVEVVPRVSFIAGFELGTGIFVNAASPESAAARLRDALRAADRG
jgi:UDPglucose--hexose-1-phosphate uridylyltransferase